MKFISVLCLFMIIIICSLYLSYLYFKGSYFKLSEVFLFSSALLAVLAGLLAVIGLVINLKTGN